MVVMVEIVQVITHGEMVELMVVEMWSWSRWKRW